MRYGTIDLHQTKALGACLESVSMTLRRCSRIPKFQFYEKLYSVRHRPQRTPSIILSPILGIRYRVDKNADTAHLGTPTNNAIREDRELLSS